MLRRIRRFLRHADPGTVRRVGAGLGAVVVMVGLGIALQTGRDGGPSSSDAAPASSSPVTVGSRPATTTTSTVPTTEPGEPAPRPRILAFRAPGSVTCGTVTSIEVSWATADATLVKLDIDDAGAFRFAGPKGSARLPFPCDGAGHVYRLVAVGASGDEVSATRRVEQQAQAR